MAGDWIPMRMDLAEDPAVIGMASELGIEECHVVGLLHRVWSWANRELCDGHARSVTEAWLDRYAQRNGFAKAMRNAGWLIIQNDDSIAFPKFDEWNSKGAKSRILSAKRQRNARHAAVTGMSRSQRDKSVTREEKRREEDKTPLPPLQGGSESDGHPSEETPQRPPAATANPVDAADSPTTPPLDPQAELAEAVVHVTGKRDGSTDRVAAELLEASPPFTTAEVREFGERFHELCPKARREGRPRPFTNELKNNIGLVRSSPRQTVGKPRSPPPPLPPEPTPEERERIHAMLEEARKKL